jgi:suppressor of G2 allele of SKP1
MPPAAKPTAVAAPVPVAAPAPAADAAAAPKPQLAESTGAAASVRHDWMQNANFVTVSVYSKGVKKENCEVDFDTDSCMITLKLNDSSEYLLHLDLAGVIDPMACKFEVLSTKVEIKLKKNPEVKWEALESAEAETLKVRSMADSDKPVQKTYPTSQGKKKDWNAVEQQLKKDEMAEKPEGDEALNKLFKEIYGNANEDTRRAMMKSFQTSGGTVLSTNWDEVGKKDYDKERDDGKLSAPNGMEWKKWG